MFNPIFMGSRRRSALAGWDRRAYHEALMQQEYEAELARRQQVVALRRRRRVEEEYHLQQQYVAEIRRREALQARREAAKVRAYREYLERRALAEEEQQQQQERASRAALRRSRQTKKSRSRMASIDPLAAFFGLPSRRVESFSEDEEEEAVVAQHVVESAQNSSSSEAEYDSESDAPEEPDTPLSPTARATKAALSELEDVSAILKVLESATMESLSSIGNAEAALFKLLGRLDTLSTRAVTEDSKLDIRSQRRKMVLAINSLLTHIGETVKTLKAAQVSAAPASTSIIEDEKDSSEYEYLGEDDEASSSENEQF